MGVAKSREPYLTPEERRARRKTSRTAPVLLLVLLAGGIAYLVASDQTRSPSLAAANTDLASLQTEADAAAAATPMPTEPPAEVNGARVDLGQMLLYDARPSTKGLIVWRDASAAEKMLLMVRQGVPSTDPRYDPLKACVVPVRAVVAPKKEYVGGYDVLVIKPASVVCSGFVLRDFVWRPQDVPALHASGG